MRVSVKKACPKARDSNNISVYHIAQNAYSPLKSSFIFRGNRYVRKRDLLFPVEYDFSNHISSKKYFSTN